MCLCRGLSTLFHPLKLGLRSRIFLNILIWLREGTCHYPAETLPPFSTCSVFDREFILSIFFGGPNRHLSIIAKYSKYRLQLYFTFCGSFEIPPKEKSLWMKQSILRVGMDRMSGFLKVRYSVGYKIQYPAYEIYRISGKYNIRCIPTRGERDCMGELNLKV